MSYHAEPEPDALAQPQVVTLESQSSTHKDDVSFDTLLKAVLRHLPDRIILGEVRGSEARTLLDAMNTGHDGTLTTIHASSPAGALLRLAALAARGLTNMTVKNAEDEVRASIEVVLQMAKRDRKRVVSSALLTRDSFGHYDCPNMVSTH
jgi:pilus assembly protein CpaF